MNGRFTKTKNIIWFKNYNKRSVARFFAPNLTFNGNDTEPLYKLISSFLLLNGRQHNGTYGASIEQSVDEYSNENGTLYRLSLYIT